MRGVYKNSMFRSWFKINNQSKFVYFYFTIIFKEMTALMVASVERNGVRASNVRLQPLVTWLHFLNFVTIAILCLLFLKIYKSLLLLYEWVFPLQQVSESPVILVLGPRNEIMQEIIYKLSETFNSEIAFCEELNDYSSRDSKPKKNVQKSQIICSHEPIGSQEIISKLRKRVQNRFGFVDILVVSQNDDPPGANSTDSFLNHLNKQLLVQFWTVMAFLPGMLRRNKGHILSIALGGSSLTNTGIMRSIHEELLQCNTKVKLTLVESNAVFENHYLPSLSTDVLASLIIRSMWNSSSVVKVPSLSSYLIMLPVVLMRFLLRTIKKMLNFSIRNI